MLEPTRRMTRSRNCFDRIAGSYMDKNGFCDGSFNTNFLKLSSAETEEKLRIAKTLPFSETNRLSSKICVSAEEHAVTSGR